MAAPRACASGIPQKVVNAVDASRVILKRLSDREANLRERARMCEQAKNTKYTK